MIEVEVEAESIAATFYEQFQFICAVLVAVDKSGGAEAFKNDPQYQNAVELAAYWANNNELSSSISTTKGDEP